MASLASLGDGGLCAEYMVHICDINGLLVFSLGLIVFGQWLMNSGRR